LKAQLKLLSTDYKQLEEVCRQIKEILDRMGVEYSGPIPLPTRRVVIPVRKTPCGDGTATWDKWEMRIHKRLFYIQPDDRALRQIMRLPIPDVVRPELRLK
jgi:small subunit ribosomal protein S10